MIKKNNTYRKGQLTFLFYKNKSNNYIAACDELCILVEEKDRELARLRMMSNCKFFIETVAEKKLGEHLLNQTLPDDIKREFIEHIKKINLKNLEKEHTEKWSINIKDLLSKKDICFA